MFIAITAVLLSMRCKYKMKLRNGTVLFAPSVVISLSGGSDSEDDVDGRDSPEYVGFPMLDASQVKQEDMDETYTSPPTHFHGQIQYDFPTFAPLSTKWLGKRRCQLRGGCDGIECSNESEQLLDPTPIKRMKRPSPLSNITEATTMASRDEEEEKMEEEEESLEPPHTANCYEQTTEVAQQLYESPLYTSSRVPKNIIIASLKDCGVVDDTIMTELVNIVKKKMKDLYAQARREYNTAHKRRTWARAKAAQLGVDHDSHPLGPIEAAMLVYEQFVRHRLCHHEE